MKHLRLKPGMSLFACAACALGLLLWARLLLVSSPPRVATAEPAVQQKPCEEDETPTCGRASPRRGHAADDQQVERVADH